VTAEVLGLGEGVTESRNRGRSPGNLGRVGAGRRRVDIRLVARRLVDAEGGLDAVAATERNVPSDVFHLLARDAEVLVVGASCVHTRSARVLERQQDGLPVARLRLLVLGVLGHRPAELLE